MLDSLETAYDGDGTYNSTEQNHNFDRKYRVEIKGLRDHSFVVVMVSVTFCNVAW